MAVPMQVLPDQACPIAQRIQVRPVVVSVTVPSALMVYLEGAWLTVTVELEAAPVPPALVPATV